MSQRSSGAEQTTNIVSDFRLNGIDQNVEKRYSLDHHRPVTTREDTSSKGEDQLRYYASTVVSLGPIVMYHAPTKRKT